MQNISTSLFGFSSNASVAPGNKPVKLFDYALAKQDLINHLYTRRGERLMMPLYGSIVWDYIMEPLTDSNRDIIIYNITSIVQSDPRFSLIDINVSEYEYGYSLQITLMYLPLNNVEQFSLDFDNRNISTIT